MTNTVSIWVGRSDENILRGNGYSIPQYPEQGSVKKNEHIIGRIDNFSGLVITDLTVIDELKSLLPTAGFWNC